MSWVRSIGNHFYWSAQSCNGNSDLLKEKWMSCVHHVANVHSRNGELMIHCEHGEVADDIAWLDIESITSSLGTQKSSFGQKIVKRHCKVV